MQQGTRKCPLLASITRKYKGIVSSNLWNEEEKRFAWRGVAWLKGRRSEPRHRAQSTSENRGKRGKDGGSMIRGFVPVDFEALLKLGRVDSMNVADCSPRILQRFGLVNLNRSTAFNDRWKKKRRNCSIKGGELWKVTTSIEFEKNSFINRKVF